MQSRSFLLIESCGSVLTSLLLAVLKYMIGLPGIMFIERSIGARGPSNVQLVGRVADESASSANEDSQILKSGVLGVV